MEQVRKTNFKDKETCSIYIDCGLFQPSLFENEYTTSLPLIWEESALSVSNDVVI